MAGAMAVRKGNRAMNVGNEESGIGSQRHRAPIMLALVALIGTVLLVIACQSPLFGTSDPFTEADLVGVWQAEYENIWAYDSQIGQVVDILGTETLTLRSDETYTQVFDDHAGNVRTADGKSWYLDETNIIHLEGGCGLSLVLNCLRCSKSRGLAVFKHSMEETCNLTQVRRISG